MSIIDFLIVYLLILPFSTFLHELGHALPTLKLTDKRATIYLGSVICHDCPRLQFKHLEIVWGYNLHPMSPLVGRVNTDWSVISPQHQLRIIAGGPLVSLLIVIIAGIFAYLARHTTSGNIAQFVAEAALIQFILTAIPMTYPNWMRGYAGLPSDGKRFQDLWRQLK